MKTNTRFFYALAAGLLLTLSAPSFGQTATAPAFADGDRWIYNVTEEKNVSGAISSSGRKWEISISRAGTKTISVSAKPSDSNMPPKEVARDVDWSVVENINGSNMITSHPYDFPMKQGKSWKVEYITPNPDARTKLVKTIKNYAVVGWVDIKVAAGNFRALKVEMEGEWTKEFNEIGPSVSTAAANDQSGSVAIAKSLKANTPKPVSGRLYQAFWFVPEIKSHVKLIVEDYQAGGALNKRITEELESSQLK